MATKLAKLINEYNVLDWLKSHTRMKVFKIINQSIFNPYYRLIHGGRCEFVDEDWDIAILLDACRYDFFSELHSFSGTLEYRISKGRRTPEFLRKNFGNDLFHDIVYVTANPNVSHIVKGQFHAIVPVWDYGWDNELKTVPPDKMVEETKNAASEYPNKRIISHFMQPHQPYIGEMRDKLGAHSGNLSVKRTALDNLSVENEDRGNERISWTLNSENKRQEGNAVPHISALLNAGIVDIELVMEAYLENLAIVLDSVEELLKSLEGRIVVTADHGELFEESLLPILPINKTYGHNTLLHRPLLVKVPWLIISSGDRRPVRSDASEAVDKRDDSDIKEKLRHLGYISK